MATADEGASPQQVHPAGEGFLDVPSSGRDYKRPKLDESAEDLLMDIFSVQDTISSESEIEALADEVRMKSPSRVQCESTLSFYACV